MIYSFYVNLYWFVLHDDVTVKILNSLDVVGRNK